MNKLITLCLATLISSQAVIASAATDTLTVYTYDSFVSKYGPGPKIKAAFEKDCNCELNFIAAEDGVSILNRLKIEGTKAKADVILGLDNALMRDAKETGLIADHQQDVSALSPTLSWSDKQFVPYDYGYFAFIYDSTKISEPATSLRQLVDSDAKIIYQDPRTSTPGQGFMFWMNAVYGDQTNTAWKQLASHTVTVSKGWWEAYSMFLEGGADYVLSYTTSPAYHMIVESESKYKAAQFSEGHIAQIEVAAALNTSSQPELAQSFLKFLISAEAQAILPVTNWMLPVLENTELPEQFSELVTPKLVDLSIETAVTERKNWIKDWRSNAAK
ncbi:thiamine ABC transporter substrate binding subunit ['Osedax' symbiont bacterium Rs2_46_30_T18]|nr:thiamine ABC transporter substrate binding subunit ['Osedax' symbiont bacterium Rs2_46_30_T18]